MMKGKYLFLCVASVFGSARHCELGESFSWNCWRLEGPDFHKKSVSYPAPECEEEVGAVLVSLRHDARQSVVRVTNSRNEEFCLVAQNVGSSEESASTDLIYTSQRGVNKRGHFCSFIPDSKAMECRMTLSFPHDEAIVWVAEAFQGLRPGTVMVCHGSDKAVHVMRYEYRSSRGRGCCMRVNVDPKDLSKVEVQLGTAPYGAREFSEVLRSQTFWLKDPSGGL